MTITTLNWTGRKKIELDDVALELDGSVLKISRVEPGNWAERLMLENGESAEFWVYVAGDELVQKNLGSHETVVDPNWPGCKIKLPDILVGRKIKVDVKVIATKSTSIRGRIVAKRNSESFGDALIGVSSDSLLPVGRSEPDEWRPWHLEFAIDGPVLRIKGDRWSAIAHQDSWRLTVLFDVVTQIFRKIIVGSGSVSWMEDWLQPIGGLGRLDQLGEIEEMDLPEALSAIDEWADTFCNELLSSKAQTIANTFVQSHLDMGE